MKIIFKRIICFLFVGILTFTFSFNDYKKAEASAVVVGGVVLGGEALLGLLSTALILSGIYEYSSPDKASSLGFSSYDEIPETIKEQLRANETQNLKDCIKNNFLANFDTENPTEFQRICIAAVNGTDGTSALENFSDRNQLKNQFKIYRSNNNNNFNSSGDKLGSLAVSGMFINTLQEVISKSNNNSSTQLLLPPISIDSFNCSYLVYRNLETRRFTYINFDSDRYKSFISDDGFHLVLSGNNYHYSCFAYDTSWSYKATHSDNKTLTFDNNQICFFSLPIYDADGNVQFEPHLYKNSDGTYNDPLYINNFSSDSGSLFNPVTVTNDKTYLIKDTDTLLDNVNQTVIQPCDDPDAVVSVPNKLETALDNNTNYIADHDLDNAEKREFVEEPLPDPEPSEEDPFVDVNDPDNLKSPGLDSKFPFCIPWDLMNCVKALVATPEAPLWVFPLKVERFNIDEEIVLDFSLFETVAKICRTLETLGFTAFLVVKTRDLIRG